MAGLSGLKGQTIPVRTVAPRVYYSITSVARSMIDGGMARPSALAVLMFTTISNLVGNCTGRSPDPTAEWIARQLTEACGWNEPPRYVVRDRDCAYGKAFIQRLGAMGIRDRPISAQSPWQNGYSERLIGSIRRDCLDHVVIFGERHLRHLLNSYQQYHNEVRTHLSLQKDAPISRTVRTVGRVLPLPMLGGLHHQYVRV